MLVAVAVQMKERADPSPHAAAVVVASGVAMIVVMAVIMVVLTSAVMRVVVVSLGVREIMIAAVVSFLGWTGRNGRIR